MTTTTSTASTVPGLPDEVVTRTPVQDVTLPAAPASSPWSPSTTDTTTPAPTPSVRRRIAGLQATVDGLRARAEAGEIQAVGITGKPFVFAVGADLSGVPYVTEREQALTIARAGHAAFASIMDLAGADLRVRQRRGHGRRGRDRPRLRPPHDRAGGRGVRAARDLPRPRARAGAAATCCRT